jgi:hypothetical protein
VSRETAASAVSLAGAGAFGGVSAVSAARLLGGALPPGGVIGVPAPASP